MTHRTWTIRVSNSNTTATSESTEVSYAIGKREWNIQNDVFECNKGQPYVSQLKLTGCNEKEFTCDDGLCVWMDQRCDQVPQCRDTSDEFNCHLLLLGGHYNKGVPPISVDDKGSVIPVDVNISIDLMKIVHMEEADHFIEFQFEINLEWREKRVSYQNLKLFKIKK